jgi:hypothetical protein
MTRKSGRDLNQPVNLSATFAAVTYVSALSGFARERVRKPVSAEAHARLISALEAADIAFAKSREPAVKLRKSK